MGLDHGISSQQLRVAYEKAEGLQLYLPKLNFRYPLGLETSLFSFISAVCWKYLSPHWRWCVHLSICSVPRHMLYASYLLCQGETAWGRGELVSAHPLDCACRGDRLLEEHPINESHQWLVSEQFNAVGSNFVSSGVSEPSSAAR